MTPAWVVGMLACRAPADGPETSWPASTADRPVSGAPNVMVLVLDDVGIEKLGAWGLTEAPVWAPVIDALAHQGLRFTHTYANPTCSPTRASILTGRHPTRTGIGRWMDPPEEDYELEAWERTLPELLAESPHGYTSLAIGKWHLGRFTRANPGLHPLEAGFSHHFGSLANPQNAYREDGAVRSYTHWEKNRDGVLAYTDVYATSDTTSDALGLLSVAPEPWFAWVAYNAAHIPMHVPPDSLHNTTVDEDSVAPELFHAVVEALDLEIGRLLSGLPAGVMDRTVVFLLSDNGTADWNTLPPYDPLRAKGTVYEIGVRVPMIAWGPGVTPGEVTSLVQVTDLFATIAEIAEVPADGWVDALGAPLVHDSVSLVPYLRDPAAPPLRETVYSEGFYPLGPPPHDTHDRMVRDDGWKLVRTERDGVASDELFALAPDRLDDGPDLLAEPLDAEADDARIRLQAEMDRMIEALTYP